MDNIHILNTYTDTFIVKQVKLGITEELLKSWAHTELLISNSPY